MNTGKQIITFSRRTDPAFFMPWFMERVRAGFCEVPNPFSGKKYLINLEPDKIRLLSFWTKNPGAVEPYVDELAAYGYTIAFFITQTGYPAYMESHVPGFEETQEAVLRLAGRLSKKAIWWRYDPIVMTRRLTADWHIANFRLLCKDVYAGRTERVILSLAHIDGPYSGIRSKLETACRANDDLLMMPSYDEFIPLAMELKKIAQAHSIRLEVCCSPAIKEQDRDKIPQGACLSMDTIRKLIPGIPDLRIKGTRKGTPGLAYAPCACVESRDIGTLATCRHGCVYCYANRRGRDEEKISTQIPRIRED